MKYQNLRLFSWASLFCYFNCHIV